MLASDFFCAQSETSIRISRRTGSLRIVSWGLSRPFMKTFDAVHSDPNDRPWVSEEALRAVCEEV